MPSYHKKCHNIANRSFYDITSSNSTILHSFEDDNHRLLLPVQASCKCQSMSVNTNKIKTITFMLSAGLAGIAGGLFAYIIGYVNPGSFNILKSTEALVIVYLGGMGSLSGAVLSAILFTVLLELLRPLQIIKWVVIPLVLIVLMQFRPEGIMGHRELSDSFPRLKRFYKFK